MQKIILKIDREEFKWLEKDIDCYILSSEFSKKFISEFYEQASKLDKIVLSEGKNAVEICKELNLDGVIADLSSTEEIKSEMLHIKSEIGDNKFLGIITRSRRHEAMIVSENEPDFVIFKVWNEGLEKLEELINWYLEFFLLQLAVIPQDDKVDSQVINADIVILDTKKYKILVDKKERLD